MLLLGDWGAFVFVALNLIFSSAFITVITREKECMGKYTAGIQLCIYYIQAGVSWGRECMCVRVKLPGRFRFLPIP